MCFNVFLNDVWVSHVWLYLHVRQCKSRHISNFVRSKFSFRSVFKCLHNKNIKNLQRYFELWLPHFVVVACISMHVETCFDFVVDKNLSLVGKFHFLFEASQKVARF